MTGRFFIFFAVVFFIPILSLAQTLSETDLGALTLVEREFQFSLDDCGRVFELKDSYSAQCNVSIGAERIARLVRNSALLHTWVYNSGESWKLYVSLSLTSQGYIIQLHGEPPMPSDRLTWRVAKKYVRSTLEEYGISQIKAYYLRPESQILNDETVVGPIYMYRRTLNLKNTEDFFNYCESLLVAKGSRFSCAFTFVSQKNHESVFTNYELAAQFKNKKENKVDIRFTNSWGWQSSGPFSTANFFTVYNGATLLPQERKELFLQALNEATWPEVNLLVHRVGDSPRISKLFYETNLGRARLSLRKFDLNFQDCKNSWRRQSGQAECQISLPFKGMRLSESTTPFQGKVIIGNQIVFVEFVLSPKNMTARIYASENILKDFNHSFSFLQKAVQSFPNGLISDLAMIW